MFLASHEASDRDEARRFLTLEHVRVDYAHDGEPFTAVDDLSLRVDAREVVAIVGPSGCGKTTVLNALAGLLEISGGRIAWQGEAAAPRSAMVFQTPRLLAWSTVLDNVAFAMEAAGRSRRDARRHAAALLERVGLAEFAGRYPRELSGGMQQRVNLSRALSIDPDLLLLDEPFASLDAQTRESMQRYLSRICETEGSTALLVTHQVDEAVYLADRVVVLSARPARVVLELTVPFARPRPLRLKREPQFRALEDEVWLALERTASAVDAA